MCSGTNLRIDMTNLCWNAPRYVHSVISWLDAPRTSAAAAKNIHELHFVLSKSDMFNLAWWLQNAAALALISLLKVKVDHSVGGGGIWSCSKHGVTTCNPRHQLISESLVLGVAAVDRYDKSINLSGSWMLMVWCCTLKYQSGSRASVRSTEEVAEAGLALVLVLGLRSRGGGSLEAALSRGEGEATLLLVSASPWYHDHIGLKMSSTLCSLHRSRTLSAALPSALPRLLALCLAPVSSPLWCSIRGVASAGVGLWAQYLDKYLVISLHCTMAIIEGWQDSALVCQTSKVFPAETCANFQSDF